MSRAASVAALTWVQARAEVRIMGTRRKSRELALQMLFQADMGKQTPEHVKKTFWAERRDLEDSVRSFADDIFRVAMERYDEIGRLLEGHTEHWRLERMAAVDRNILRAGVAEFLGFPNTPFVGSLGWKPARGMLHWLIPLPRSYEKYSLAKTPTLRELTSVTLPNGKLCSSPVAFYKQRSPQQARGWLAGVETRTANSFN